MKEGPEASVKFLGLLVSNLEKVKTFSGIIYYPLLKSPIFFRVGGFSGSLHTKRL